MTVTDLPNLAHLTNQPTRRGGRLDNTWDEYRATIVAHINNLERTLQTRIGPSELGGDCLKCLARKLAGRPERRGEDWLPFVGTNVHAGIADAFHRANAEHPGPPRYLIELSVDVGTVGGVNITGHLDLYDIATAQLTDWKIVGVSTLRAARVNGPPAGYRGQQHLYGLGCTRRGLPVDTVRIAFLPRNATTLSGAVIWTEKFDPALAVGLLERANRIANQLADVGHDALIDSLPGAPGCYSCFRYPLPDGTYPATKDNDPFADLIGQS